jgi:phosphoglycolate phosphatase/pyrophosphatase PpaX
VKADRIRDVLGRWSLPADRAAYVGDAPSDVTVAREEGLVALAAAWAATADVDGLVERAPTALFRTVASFAEWVERHTG